MKSVTLYHSVICPRCQLSKLVLRQVLKEFPDVRVEKKEARRLIASLTSHRESVSPRGYDADLQPVQVRDVV